ncbi:MAG: CheD, stimulates methylation of protein [Myxococcaceae bacterium]|nr:CheD, stimulates methylation of protein [Myxococcaceae bacterium]
MTGIDVTLRIGGVFATDRQSVLRTVLGSCISACLFDPISRVGGMNHFMLPCSEEVAATDDLTRYGAHAMEVLIGAIQRLGGRRDRLQAKIFGGGHVLQTAAHPQSVPARNIAFIEKYVAEENIEVVSQDLGGYLARRVHFYPQTGKVLLQRLGQRGLRDVQLEETQAAKIPAAPLPSTITLFD